jgi:hypothetical protein
LGFRRILVPAGSRDRLDNVIEVRHLSRALGSVQRIADEGG